jgi:hypothetical protein
MIAAVSWVAQGQVAAMCIRIRRAPRTRCPAAANSELGDPGTRPHLIFRAADRGHHKTVDAGRPGPQPGAQGEIGRVLAHVPRRPRALRGVAQLIGREDSRAGFLAATAASLSPRESVRIDVRDPGASLSLVISADPPSETVRLRLDADTDLSGLPHPVAQVLPAPGGAHALVRTRACKAAAFDFLAPDLVGPDTGTCGCREADLLAYLGRVIDAADAGYRPGYRAGYRYVEPGVGRSYLVDFVRLRGRPQYRDFSVTGVGLTPFSREGYFFQGPHIDGHLLLARARHRRQVGDVLAAAGCRVPAVAAIITDAELKHTMPDESRQPGALLVRGFRSVLRVKQLDPVANLLMSAPAWSEPVQKRLRGQASRPCTCLSPSFFLGTRSGRRCDESRGCQQQRTQLARANAARLLRHVYRRLAADLGRDPAAQPVSPGEYVAWFAATMGTQLAIMRRERFLHDYRLGQKEWHDPHHLLDSLMDTNVTLLAEFPDLDTGIFVDRCDSDTRDALGITRAAADDLAAGFAGYHAIETRIARGICETVEKLALPDGGECRARQLFVAAYERAADGSAASPPPRRRDPDADLDTQYRTE